MDRLLVPPLVDPAVVAYQNTASVYDQITAHHDYADWLDNLLPAARAFGLGGDRVLDVACGTGKSFLPLLEAGWSVRACDISSRMLDRAARRAQGRAQLDLCDMRWLPVLGEFDLVLCLGDSLNYLLDPQELGSTLFGMKANLAAGGVLLFDLNSLLSYRTFYVGEHRHQLGERELVWCGMASPSEAVGSTVEGRLEERTDRGPRTLAVHRQRHYPAPEVSRLLTSAGFDRVEILGQGYDARLEHPLDELRHTKAIFLAATNTEHARG